MRRQPFQQAARAAFSTQDWVMLMRDGRLARSFAQLTSVEAVEAFIYEAYDCLKQLRENQRLARWTDRQPADGQLV